MDASTSFHISSDRYQVLKGNLQPIEDTMRHQFIPAITGGKTINNDERELLSLPPRHGGLSLKNVCNTAPIEFENSLQNDILGISTDGENEALKTTCQIKVNDDNEIKKNWKQSKQE